MSIHQYNISLNGFLPDYCLTKLPSSWSHFQPLLDQLSTEDGLHFRSLVHSLPQHSPKTHSLSSLTDSEKRLIFSAISLITQKYIWCCGKDNFANTIPAEIGLPLLEASRELKQVPVLNYAAIVLYNWSLKDNSQPISLDNLKINYKLIEDRAFEWFCVVHTAIEACGGNALKQMNDAKKYIKNNDSIGMQKVLKSVADTLKVTTDLLRRMYEHCPPQDFWRFRFYFEGTSDPVFFPQGLQIKGVKHEPIVYKGSSGTQSTLIQSFDAFFGVDHPGHGKVFFKEMRDYMPPEHSKFLKDLTHDLDVQGFVSNTEDKALVTVYEEAVNNFTKYRQVHLKLVHDYIIKVVADRQKEREEADRQAKKAETGEKVNQSGEIGLYKENGVGTGGSDALSFLSQTIKSTREAKDLDEKAIVERTIGKDDDNHIQYDTMTGRKEYVKKGEFKIDKKRVEDFLVSFVIGLGGAYVTKMIMTNLMVM